MRREAYSGALLPAFADTHIHFMSRAPFSSGLDVREAKTFEEAVATWPRRPGPCSSSSTTGGDRLWNGRARR
jgi:predicted amidohydrolase YtcJ